MTKLNEKRAISTVLSTLLFVILIIIATLLLYNFVNQDMDNFLEDASRTFKLRIGNIRFNQTCMAIDVVNSGERNATIEKVYINKELRAFNLLDHDLKIPIKTSKEIYIFGSFNPGCNFDIKIIFESGYSIFTVKRY